MGAITMVAAYRGYYLGLVQLTLCAAAAGADLPHIIHVLADDLGWAEVGFYRPSTDTHDNVHSPNIDDLTRHGLRLERFYVHKICSPTRCSLQTGRAPIHVNVQNVLPESTNPSDQIGGWQGIPLKVGANDTIACCAAVPLPVTS